MNSPKLDADVLVVGAGLAGLSAATRLQAAELEVKVVERASAVSAAGAGIMLHPNALRILDDAVYSRLRRLGAEIRRQVSVDPGGSYSYVEWRSVWCTDQLPLAVHRLVLANVLLDQLERGTVSWATVPLRLAMREDSVEVMFTDGTSGRYRLVVGADGIHSWTRQFIDRTARPVHLGQIYWRTVADAALWPEREDEWRTWRGPGGSFFGLMPIGSGRIHLFLQMPAAMMPSDWHGERADAQAVVAHASAVSAEAGDLASAVRESTFDVRPAYRLDCKRWARDRLVLVGDASHAVSPATTQGGALAIEDAAVLADEVERWGPCPAALTAFEQRRRRRVSDFLRLASFHIALMEALAATATTRSGPDTSERDVAPWFRRIYRPLMTPA